MNNAEIFSDDLAVAPELPAQPLVAARGVNWNQVGWFLGLAFGLAWLIDLVLYLNGGLTHPAAKLLLQFQMMMPAFSALLLGTYFFKNSPIFIDTNRGPSRWFTDYYFFLTFLYLFGAVYSLVEPGTALMNSTLLLIPNIIGLILLVVLRVVGGKDTFAAAGMGGGKARWWLLLGLGMLLFYGLQSLLNYVFKLGTLIDLNAPANHQATGGMPVPLFVLIVAVQAIVLGPILGLILSFGEEYGWRGFLQSELTRLGRVRGVLILGVIWGVWHWPLIWMGYNYPGQPVLGSLLMVVFTVILAFFLAYAVFKSGGVWTAAYLHAVNNQVLSFFSVLVVPSSVLYSFGIGLPTLALGALVVLLLLRDPVWRE